MKLQAKIARRACLKVAPSRQALNTKVYERTSMSTYKLLSIESDAKTTKGTALGYLTGILYLAPATEADGKHNLCPMASAECREACLYSAGMAAVFPTVKRADSQNIALPE